ncbi:MAG TPA: hypothetical protein VK458_25120, partial [Myxococcaceae bacterium]|nr:hypothetical protein [Myxococcaceae bacterium]
MAVAIAAIFTVAQPAQAASNTCRMLKKRDCTTTSVRANPNGHFVHIDVSPRVSYIVYDSDNGVAVKRGRSAAVGTRQTITGLYGRYHVKAKALSNKRFHLPS